MSGGVCIFCLLTVNSVNLHLKFLPLDPSFLCKLSALYDGR